MRQVNKQHELTINISPQSRTNIITNTTFFSMDVRTGKKIINFTHENEPIDLTNATVMLGFEFVGANSSKIIDSKDGSVVIEDALDGKCSVILPNHLYQYAGQVLVHVYITFSDGRSLDCGVIVTEFEESWLDSELSEMSQFYVKRFEDLAQVIKARVDELHELLNDEKFSGSVPKDPMLPIFSTTEDEFWNMYNDGSITDGLYQFMEAYVAFRPFSDLEFQASSHTFLPGAGYIKHNGKYYIGNNDANPFNSNFIVMDNDGENAKILRPYTLQYAYFGHNTGGLGIDDNGYLYCSTRSTVSPAGAIVSLSTYDQNNIATHNVNSTTTPNYTFRQVSYFANSWERTIPTLTIGDSFATNDGGIFSVPTGVGAVLYLKDGQIQSRSSANYIIDGSNVCAVEKETNRLFMIHNTSTLLAFDINCNVVSYPIEIPTGIAIQNVTRQGIIARNGRLLIDLPCTVLGTGASTRFVLVFNTTTNTWEITQEVMALRGQTNINTSMMYTKKFEMEDAVIYKVFSGPRNVHIKWNYISNQITSYVSNAASGFSNVVPTLLTDGNEIFNSYSQGANAIIEVINPTNMTAHSYTLPINNAGRELSFTKDDGMIYVVSYAMQPGLSSSTTVFATIDPIGNISIKPAIQSQLSLSNRSILDKVGDFIVVVPGFANNPVNTTFNINDNTLSYTDHQGLFPLMRTAENGFIYTNRSAFVKPSFDQRRTSRLVSWGEIIL